MFGRALCPPPPNGFATSAKSEVYDRQAVIWRVRMVSGKRRSAILGLVSALGLAAAVGSPVAADQPPPPTYRAVDYGTALNILPAGENGLATGSDITSYEQSGARPAYSHDQYDPYQNLLYGVGGLNDAALGQYYKDASFGIPASDIDTARTATLSPGGLGNVSIYRDKSHGVPHIYGTTIPAMAYGAGYAAAADRLFLIDILRHLGRGHLAEFAGATCSIEQRDYAQRLVADYTDAEKDAQLASTQASGPLGAELISEINAFVQGVNQYVTDAISDPNKMPGDYAVSNLPAPQPNWQPRDIFDITSLESRYGLGGGNEVGNAALYNYLVGVVGQSNALRAFHDFKDVNDPDAPTTLTGVSFPYNTQQPTAIDPTLNAVTDSANLTGLKPAHGTNCGGTNTLFGGLPPSPAKMSNALLVAGNLTSDGHPIAVMGPQVGYYAPQILMEVDLHAPDYDARGLSFPGTNFVVQGGRGRDFAWSATSANTDVVDQKVVRVYNDAACTSTSSTPSSNLFYLFAQKCRQLVLIPDSENAPLTVACNPPPPSPTNCVGPDLNLDHSTYRVLDTAGNATGIVQGWTTVGGNPVAVYNQSTNYFDELGSWTGFVMWHHPSMTFDVNSWMVGAGQIHYTFNWHYIDSQHIGYYVSGKDPLRNPAVDPGLPTWGGGAAEWQGFLDFNAHPHQADPAQGYMIQWNNKPAPMFGAADDTFRWGMVQRQQMLVSNLQAQLTAHGGHVSRADLVAAMETAASQDLSAVSVMPELTPFLGSLPSGPQAMLDHVNAWVAAGAHRRKNAVTDSEYADVASVAAMDELYPRIVTALFGGFPADIPMGYDDPPSNHIGSAYWDGWEGNVVKVLRQLRGEAVSQPFSDAVNNRLCGSGLSNCQTALGNAVVAAYDAMVSANGGSTNVAGWSRNTALNQAGGTMSTYDNIPFTAAGVIGQPALDWQNRPTFQQVVEFQSHAPGSGGDVPEFPIGPLAPIAGALATIGVWVARRRRGRPAA
jgi:acyl-homoserine lactone acylase PvdQ